MRRHPSYFVSAASNKGILKAVRKVHEENDLRIQEHLTISILLALGICLCIPAPGQVSAAPSRVVERVDQSRTLVLTGNTHYLARAEFDRGPVDPQLSLDRMQLVLKRSAEQEAALESFMAEQVDPTSPNFHHWLEPEEFGRLYGPSDSDMAAVTNWLQNQGFRIDGVSQGRVTIEFSGTAGQVREAFQTELHHYLVNGRAHIANNRDPQIPAALSPVVTGIASLHDFFPRHQSELGRFVRMEQATHKVTPIELPAQGPKANYVFSDPNSGGINNEDIGPYDFAAMYNLTPLWNAGITGKGISIAIAAETDINLKDVATFRTFFGLSKFSGTARMVLNGADPGTIQGAVVENTLDTEWAGAAAPDATVLVVASKGTATSFGGLLSMEYIVDNKVAPVMSGSYGTCEAGLAAAGNANLNAMYQQGSAEGISIFESAGDQGSTGCDNSDATVYPNPAQNGLQVNGFVSSPYVTGVGGTDIVWQEDPYSKYWTANTASHASAIGYIPEIPWNSTCTDSYLLTYVYTGQTSSEALCNNAIAAGLDEMVRVVGGSGGKSSCLSNKGTFASCTGAYAKPAWQTGTGVPADKVRDVPDVSLFASSGLPSGNGGSAYLICVSSNSPDKTCDYTGSNIVAQEVGGTSVSSPAMAGIMALVVQKAGGAYQGLANPVFYGLAAKETLSACNANTVANGNRCIFYDTTTGTNAMPCLSGSLNCAVKTSGDKIGIVTGYSTSTGYDLATGLGSVNAANLVNAWPTAAPAVTVSPTTYGFATAIVGTTSGTKGVVTLKNAGTAAVTIGSVKLTGTDASSFAASTTCPVGSTLAAGASCAVTLSFKPAAVGALLATLSVVDGAGTQTVEVSGTGVASTAPAVTLSASSLTFAATMVGTPTAAQVLTVKNSGTAALTLTSETVTGTNATSFLKSATTCGASLAVGASCTVSVEFKPLSTGALAAALAIADNATGSPQQVKLSGTGTAPAVTLTPASIVFPATITGATSDAQLATLKNSGTAALTLKSIALGGTSATSFLWLGDCGASLAPGASCSLYAAFKPASAGALAATLIITDNAAGSPHKVALTGAGAAPPALKLSTASLAFPVTTHGTVSTYAAVTVTNAGTATIAFSSITLAGANPTDFVQLQTCGATLAPAASCEVYIAFKPAAIGAFKATLSIADNGAASPQSVALSGTGR